MQLDLITLIQSLQETLEREGNIKHVKIGFQEELFINTEQDINGILVQQEGDEKSLILHNDCYEDNIFDSDDMDDENNDEEETLNT